MSRIEYTSRSLVSPSILSADFGRFGEMLKMLEKGGADWVHLDVMDGHFVPNLTIGPSVIRSLRHCTELPFDVHLMIENPDPFLADFKEAGADLLTVHARACKDLYRTLHQIKRLGLKAGVSLSPATPLAEIEGVLDLVDLVLVMSVSPGFGGQSFIPQTLDKLRNLKHLIQGRPIFIEVDGGIHPENATSVREAGGQVLVSGSAVFKDFPAIPAVIEALRHP
jgi:ribulose-phosphate 3-epimerase